jgi:hypothetical protein
MNRITLNINSLKYIMEVQSYYKPHITEFSYIIKFASPLKQGIKRIDENSAGQNQTVRFFQTEQN